MKVENIKSRIEAPIMVWLNKIPLISFYARTRGWSYLISWCHRITGVLLVISFWIYLYCFHALQVSKALFVLDIFLWILAIPTAFHAFNGARLILYECFGNRNDEAMIRWVFSLTFIYLIILGIFMLMGNQSVSPFLYWVIVTTQALVIAYGVALRLFSSSHSLFWRMQRISGSFLLVTVLAYLLFTQLKPSPEIEANSFIKGIQGLFVEGIYLLLLLSTLFHAGYGIWSVGSDYLSSQNLRRGLAVLMTIITLIFAWVGLRAILNI